MASTVQSVAPVDKVRTLLGKLNIKVPESDAVGTLRTTMTPVVFDEDALNHLDLSAKNVLELGRFVDQHVEMPARLLVEELTIRVDRLKEALVKLKGQDEAEDAASEAELVAQPFGSPDLTPTPTSDGTALRKIAVVISDFDKTVYQGDSHADLIKHGLVSRFRDIIQLDRPLERLQKTILMTWQYKRHKIHEGQAADAVATLLDGIPVKPIADRWARSPSTRHKLKHDVLALLEREAQRLVREEWEQEVRDGKRKAIDWEKLRVEAAKRIYFATSQIDEVAATLTEVGEQHANYLGARAMNIIGSQAEFSSEGVFKKSDKWVYCFKGRKRQSIEDHFEANGVIIDRDKTVTLSDDHFYDGPMLEIARNPHNRYIVDPDRDDAAYAESEGTNVVVDDDFEWMEARWVPESEEDKSKKKLEILERKTFFPDSRANVTWRDKPVRAFYGALEMTPVTLWEVVRSGGVDAIHEQMSHGNFAGATAAALPLGAGMLYGVFNRGRIGHLMVGALVAGGSLAAGAGHVTSEALQSAAVGAATLYASHGLADKLVFKGTANLLGRDGFGKQSKVISMLARLGITSGWTGLMRLLGMA